MSIGTKVPILLLAVLPLALVACNDDPNGPVDPAARESGLQGIDAAPRASWSPADTSAAPSDNAEIARHGTPNDRDPVPNRPIPRPVYPEGMQSATQPAVPDRILVDDLAAREQVMSEDQSRNPAHSEIDRHLPQPSMEPPPPDPETSPSGG